MIKVKILVVILTVISFFSLFAQDDPGDRSVFEWSESFDALDESIWLLQEFSFYENGSNMFAGNLVIEDSILSILTEKNSGDKPKDYNGGGLGSREFRSYGLFVARIKPCAVKGSVSGFFLMNKWIENNWVHKEIDFEFLGKNPGKVQLTTHLIQGSNVKFSTITLDLGFDYSKDFHEYAILWTKSEVKWFVDKRLIHTEKKYVPDEDLQIRLNLYVGNMDDPGIRNWLGRVDKERLPGATLFDWVKYYSIGSVPEEYLK